jgi:hypothetical protein
VDHLPNLPFKSKGELPTIPVDERAEELRGSKWVKHLQFQLLAMERPFIGSATMNYSEATLFLQVDTVGKLLGS